MLTSENSSLCFLSPKKYLCCQSFFILRLSKKSLIMQGRYRHAPQGKRANKQVRKLKTYLGCVVLDIERKIEGSSNLQKHFSPFLETAHRLLSQQRKTRISCKACMCWKWSVLPKARRIRNTSLVAR